MIRRIERGSVALFAGLVLGLSLHGCWISETTDVRGETDQGPVFEEQILDMLTGQADAWNAGDLDGFMVDYERTPTTSYIGSTGLITGFDAIRERYAPRFLPGAERDSLRFVDLHTRQLDPRFGLATARYVLYRDGQTTSTGPFTLVLVNVEGSWKITHDQSASDPPPAEPE
jgi:hypothetical protein